MEPFLAVAVIAIAFGAVFVAIIWGISGRQIAQFRRADPGAEPLEVAKLANEVRKTNVTIFGAVAVVASVIGGIYGLYVTQRELDQDRFRTAVEMLGSENESVRAAGIYELGQVSNYAPTRSETAAGVLRTFVEGSLQKQERSRQDQLELTISEIIDATIPRDQAVEIRNKVIMLARKRQFRQADADLEQELANEHPELFSRLSDATSESHISMEHDLSVAIAMLGEFAVARSPRGVQISGIPFIDSSFSKASLRGSQMRGCEFLTCDLSSADLSNADATESRFLNSDLVDVDFRGADLSRTTFSHCELKGAKFDPGQLDDARELHWVPLDDIAAISNERRKDFTFEIVEGQTIVSGPTDRFQAWQTPTDGSSPLINAEL